jgi:alpha-N-arabinofuranosidase
MYGAWQIGATTADDYVHKARQFAAILTMTDPSIELVGCGQWGWTDWDRTVIDGLAPYVRYHSIHLYTGSGDYWRNVLSAHQADRAIRICERLIERARYQQRIEHPIGIAFDEWNVWYRTRSPEQRHGGPHGALEEQYDLADALTVATYLNIFIRHCRSVEIANLAQMVNVIAPIFTSRQGLFLQTIYHPLRLYAEHVQPVALDPLVDSPEDSLSAADEQAAGETDRTWQIADLGPFKLLDVSATIDPAGRELCLAVVNRDRAQALRTTIQLVGHRLAAGARLYVVDGADPSVTNSFEQPTAVEVHERRLEAGGTSVEATFAPHSITLLRGQLE